MTKAILFLSLFFLSGTCSAQSFVDSLDQAFSGAEKFLVQTQVKENIGTEFYKGEWATYLTNLQTNIYLGNKGDSDYDSNCFSTAIIHNIICGLVLTDSFSNENLISVLSNSMECIMSYRRGNGFSFWHVLPASPHLTRGRYLKHPEDFFQTRPNHKIYEGPFLTKYANIPNDADDSGMGLLAILNFNKVMQKFSMNNSVITEKNIDSVFVQWRDVRKVRRSFSYYNSSEGFGKRTGAFLTWLDIEPMYLPWRIFLPSAHKPNMPTMSNDVDCIVNCNVLKTLHAYGLDSAIGFSQSVSLVKKALSDTSLCAVCGIYYPSEFSLQYFASETFSSGVSELGEVVKSSIPFILSKQNGNGSWSSAFPENNFHVTALCVNALLNSGIRTEEVMNAVESGIRFLISNEKENSHGIFWTGGIFFSGGHGVRKTQVWRSDAVTTALVLEALMHYRKFILKN